MDVFRLVYENSATLDTSKDLKMIVMKEPKISVGIMFEPKIDFLLLNTYLCGKKEISGKQTVQYDNQKILWNETHYDELIFTPKNERTDVFELTDVTIGINFHWERKENQRFNGALKIIVEDEKLTAINVISIEDYLTSVISSEMSATASLELLKAHAVISRSWLLAKKTDESNGIYNQSSSVNVIQTNEGTNNEEYIRWWDREDHIHFDVCADDHCQRYQGITRASTEKVKQAVEETRGEVLTFNNKICDARFSKCCGGVFEEFQYCWDETVHPYLRKERDSKKDFIVPELRFEDESQRWIRTSPEAFCNTKNKKVLAQVLNNYDQETTDFYRWKVEYSQDEISELILRRSGVDYGEILDLLPIQRGTSGRLVKLKIVGTKRTRTIGKELEIRRTLSNSHLYSSAFVVDKEYTDNTVVPAKFILIGSGWGHGVGLCQIGAAVMGDEGYSYNQILLHYYIGAQIDRLY
ncbi:SpoIID/LytB domain protein [uncultured Paludibacter sp.]|uniref:SpoIID/LytB domain protein n=1 Tax=uncultured Paludibacter sp. TaxID=497635 RepID=A0A653AHN3_9BACT|nr:SpoIID/LytB domain protein [uncultured Paludibacter sp.]